MKKSSCNAAALLLSSARLLPAGLLALAAGAASASSTVLYTQNGAPENGGIPSQNFEPARDRFDSRSADDFTVPTGHTWVIDEVDVVGAYFDGTGLAQSENVTFYEDANGLPGAVIADYVNRHGIDNGSGSLGIRIPKTKLKAGIYWLSVQANMNFDLGGEWAWKSQDVISGSIPAWENPEDGFSTGCITYTAEATCFDGGFGDHIFTLKGKAK